MEIQWKVPLMLFGPISKAVLNECDLGLRGSSETPGLTIHLVPGKSESPHRHGVN